MKKQTFLFLSCLLLTISAFSQVYVQTFNEYGGAEGKAVNINELDIEFCKIAPSRFSTKPFNLVVDYGQKFQEKRTKVVDQNGKLLEFNSMTDAMNHFHRNGWDYVEPDIFGDAENAYPRWLIFRKM